MVASSVWGTPWYCTGSLSETGVGVEPTCGGLGAHLPPLGGHPVEVGVGQWRLRFDLPLRQHVVPDDGHPLLKQTPMAQ